MGKRQRSLFRWQLERLSAAVAAASVCARENPGPRRRVSRTGPGQSYVCRRRRAGKAKERVKAFAIEGRRWKRDTHLVRPSRRLQNNSPKLAVLAGRRSHATFFTCTAEMGQSRSCASCVMSALFVQYRRSLRSHRRDQRRSSNKVPIETVRRQPHAHSI